MARARRSPAFLPVLLGLSAGVACASARGTGPLAGAAVGPLDIVTLITRDDDTCLRLYRDALGMRLQGPLPLDKRTRKTERRLWGMPAGVEWQMYLFDQPAVPGSLRVRLLVIDQETARIRTAWSARGPGPLGLGFAAPDLRALDLEMRRLGFSSLNELEAHHLARPGGRSCDIRETTFNGPDYVQTVLLAADESASPGDTRAPSGGGRGPIWSAQSVSGLDEVLAFYTGVLGLTLRDDLEWQGGRLATLGSARDATPRLLFIDPSETLGSAQRGVAPRPPSRGLAMWSFPVRDLREMAQRTRAARVPTLRSPVVYTSPDLGRVRAMTVLAPDGFLVELYEPLAPRP